VGRLAVFHNRKHNQVYRVNAGMFGYLDMVDDLDMAFHEEVIRNGALHGSGTSNDPRGVDHALK